MTKRTDGNKNMGEFGETYEERAQLAENEVTRLRIQLEAWHSVFGTSQLSHAQARLEVAEDSLKRKTSDLERLTAYSDKLAAGLPCLPKDVEVLMKANGDMAIEIDQLKKALKSQ